MTMKGLLAIAAGAALGDVAAREEKSEESVRFVLRIR